MLPITRALRWQDRSSFEALLADVDAFSVKVINPDTFPQREDGGWGGAGAEAVSQLLGLERLRSGCYNAPPGQSLAAIPAVMLLPNNKTTGVLARFDEAGKLKAMFFAEPSFIADITGTPNWPDPEQCALI